MRIHHTHQLLEQLQRRLMPAYCVCGREPLQFDEALIAIRTHAQQQGFTERCLLEQTKEFDWQQFHTELLTPSLFTQRRLVELRVNDKLGRDGSEALQQYAQRPPTDVIVVIAAPELDWKDLKAKWVAAFDRIGVIFQVRGLSGGELQKWLQHRLRAQGFTPTADALALLAAYGEGNLLAINQEINKLVLLHPPGTLDAATLLDVLADSACFNPYDLTEAALQGDLMRALRIVDGLEAEGVALPILLWIVTHNVRVLAALVFARKHGQETGSVFKTYQIWDAQRPKYTAAAQRYTIKQLWELLLRCSQLDLVIKGRVVGDPWLQFKDLVYHWIDTRHG
jgi:DNA polymerase-3 subunit delta